MDASLLSRREWIAKSGAALAVAALGVSSRSEAAHAGEDLVLNPRGAYRFVPGVPFLSFGVVATDGFEIVRTTFRQARPFPAGMADIEQVLRSANRPRQALCGLELRSTRGFMGPEFVAFNMAYTARLTEWDLMVGSHAPVTRTNVAFAPANTLSGEPAVTIHAFSYTVPASSRGTPPTFVLAGMPEIRNLRAAVERREPPAIVAVSDTTPAGVPTAAALRAKTEFILAAIDETLRTVGAGWPDVTGIQLYTAHDVHPLVSALVLPHVGPAARFGVEWHHTYPPGVHVEIGVRGIRLESFV